MMDWISILNLFGEGDYAIALVLDSILRDFDKPLVHRLLIEEDFDRIRGPIIEDGFIFM